MANTVKFTLTDSAWTNVSAGNASGFATIEETVGGLLYMESDSAPSIGADNYHTIKKKGGDDISFFNIVGLFNVYMRSNLGETKVAVTYE